MVPPPPQCIILVCEQGAGSSVHACAVYWRCGRSQPVGGHGAHQLRGDQCASACGGVTPCQRPAVLCSCRRSSSRSARRTRPPRCSSWWASRRASSTRGSGRRRCRATRCLRASRATSSGSCWSCRTSKAPRCGRRTSLLSCRLSVQLVGTVLCLVGPAAGVCPCMTGEGGVEGSSGAGGQSQQFTLLQMHGHTHAFGGRICPAAGDSLIVTCLWRRI